MCKGYVKFERFQYVNRAKKNSILLLLRSTNTILFPQKFINSL